jgi:hypothetical protein
MLDWSNMREVSENDTERCSYGKERKGDRGGGRKDTRSFIPRVEEHFEFIMNQESES